MSAGQERQEGHDWFMPSFTSAWEACRKCGVVKRADGQNGPCRGVVKIAMRETDHAEMGGERRKGERRVKVAPWYANIIREPLILRREDAPWKTDAEQWYAWQPDRRVCDRRNSGGE